MITPDYAIRHRTALEALRSKLIESVVTVVSSGLDIDLGSQRDRDMTRLFAGALVAALDTEATKELVLKLRSGAMDESFVRPGDDPDWGTGLRLDFSFGREFLVLGLRYSATAELFITANFIDVDAHSDDELVRVEYAEQEGTPICRLTGCKLELALNHPDATGHEADLTLFFKSGFSLQAVAA